jgi:hypothetical protein
MLKRKTLSHRRSSVFAIFFAIMLSLVTVTNTFAAPLTNGDFHVYNTHIQTYFCSLNGWSNNFGGSAIEGGDAGISGLGVSSSSDCLGKVAIGAGYLTQSEITYTLSQTFTVPTTGSKKLSFYVWAKSSDGVSPLTGATEPTYKNQIIKVLNSSGQIIVEGAHNFNMTFGTGVFDYDLVAYAGQNVTLQIQVRKSNTFNTPSDTVSMYVDNVQWGSVTVPFGTGGVFDW